MCIPPLEVVFFSASITGWGIEPSTSKEEGHANYCLAKLTLALSYPGL